MSADCREGERELDSIRLGHRDGVVIGVIRDNHLLVYDVDYTIDSLGQVVLLTTELGPGEQIFFTILQGAMMDVPNFNVIDAVELARSSPGVADINVLIISMRPDVTNSSPFSGLWIEVRVIIVQET